jgi:hypothetical protein
MIGAKPFLERWITEAPPDSAWIDVLEFMHPAWPQGFILANWHLDADYIFEDGRRVRALALALRVDLPDAGTDGRQDMSITMDNVGAEMFAALEQAQAWPQYPIRVSWRAFLSNHLTEPGAEPVELTIVNTTVTPIAVQMVASRTDIINRRWPRKVYRVERWPGLNR